MRRLRKGDEVVVIAGRARGSRGSIDKIVADELGNVEHVVIEGVNLGTKHAKPDPSRQKPGGIEKISRPIHASNVALVNPKGKNGRIRIEIADGVKKRVFVHGGQEVGES
ncbi:MAG: 50S ribosomal protein L24 [Betaproteobacteria bacterium]|nr:50S ribosomal protein L24 [Betaproteobacteria bacterium]